MRLGDVLGQYRIVDFVGSGGMATVYVGEHLVVGHRVALKVIHPRHLDNPRMARRFLKEAQAVAAIRHPGIVEFYDFGVSDDGRAFMAMELLSGQTLASRLKPGAMPISHAVAFARQMASALGAAHTRGIIHRDLTPSNVFLVPDPDVWSGERAKVLDFGIAKHTRDADEQITASGVLIGTPAHMSPEQCRGDQELDGRADVYALGILLYCMVTGRLPFDGQGSAEILSRQVYELCPSPLRLNPRLPPALAAVIQRCMEKDRERRYATMDDLAAALDAVISQPPEHLDDLDEADLAGNDATSIDNQLGAVPMVMQSNPTMRLPLLAAPETGTSMMTASWARLDTPAPERLVPERLVPERLVPEHVARQREEANLAQQLDAIIAPGSMQAPDLDLDDPDPISGLEILPPVMSSIEPVSRAAATADLGRSRWGGRTAWSRAALGGLAAVGIAAIVALIGPAIAGASGNTGASSGAAMKAQGEEASAAPTP